MNMNGEKRKCIMVLGMHRSGTSALTGVLGLLDIYLGSELIQADPANSKGYFENSKINTFNEELLNSMDSSWMISFSMNRKSILCPLTRES
jgi:hypothetical protein